MTGQEWLEIAEYQKQKHEEEQQQIREARFHRKIQYKQELDQHLEIKRENSTELHRQEQAQVQKILETARLGLQQEVVKKLEKKQLLKDQNQLHLIQALSSRMRNEKESLIEQSEAKQNFLQHQIQEYLLLKSRLDAKQQKKQDILEQLQLSHNRKQNHSNTKHYEWESDMKMIEDYNKSFQIKEQIKQQQRILRESKVRHIMDTLGTQIMQKEVQKEKQLEEIIVKREEQLEQKQSEIERQKYEARVKAREDIKRTLFQQMLEKLQYQKIQESEKINQRHELDQTYLQFNKQQQQKLQQKRISQLVNLSEQQKQVEDKIKIQSSPLRSISNGNTTMYLRRKQNESALAMNEQEILINKSLLEEIRQNRKNQNTKEGRFSSLH